MYKIFRYFQFFPIAVFLYFSNNGDWGTGFQIGGAVAALELLIIFILQVSISRIVFGVNAYLIFGGLGFYFGLQPVLNLLSHFKESLLFACIFIILLTFTFVSKFGVFEASEVEFSKKYSIALTIITLICLIWSYFSRGDSFVAGTVPFLALISFQAYFRKKISTEGCSE